MRRIAAILLVALLVPQVAFGAWWNPFSWFVRSEQEKSEVSNTSEDVEMTKTSRFYVKYNNSRVRTCESINCSVIGYYKIGDYFDNTENQILEDIPEWVRVSWNEAGVTKKYGYISKSVLSETPVYNEANNQQLTTTTDPNLTNRLTKADISVINGWLSYIDVEIKAGNDLKVQIKDSVMSDSADDVIDVIELYVKNMSLVKSQIITAVSTGKRDGVRPILARAEELESDFDSDLEIAIDISLANAERNAQEARYRALNETYRQRQRELDELNNARINAANTATQKYNDLLQAAKENGTTESVFNAQLQGAGLIPQSTYCTSRPTFPGGGGHYTITCN